MAVDTGAEGYDAFPLQSFLDFDIRDGPDGAVVAFLEVDDRHLNPNGIVHGGVVFTLADTAMGRATMAVLGDGQICASIEVSVRYLRPIPGDDSSPPPRSFGRDAGSCTWSAASPSMAMIARWPCSRGRSPYWRPEPGPGRA